MKFFDRQFVLNHTVDAIFESVLMNKKFTIFCFLVFTGLASPEAKAQFPFGRVLLNEYLPWPNNECGATAEFVELYNMGPGPVDIGCYVLTDGDFSVTIPEGTIMEPGTFYVISGQWFIPAPCANIGRNIVADLNWNDCGCSSDVIPASAPGFFTDGGFASEQIALLDPAGKVVDAIVRTFPTEPSSTITTAATPGCSPFTFNLDNMGVEYENIGESAGRGNSIARKLDGDCGWVKDTQQSGGATNNTPGARSSFTLSMYITEDIFCMYGMARFVVDQNPASAWFPVDYILGYDSDRDGHFTLNDTYTNGIDYDAPELIIENLPFGLYAINIGPRQGCSYQNFVFAVGPCTTLQSGIRSFSIHQLDGLRILAEITGGDNLKNVFLEGSVNGKDFTKITDLSFNYTAGVQEVSWKGPANDMQYFRLVIVNKDHKAMYSPVRKLNNNQTGSKLQLAGNPVFDQFRLYATSIRPETLELHVYNGAGQQVLSRKYQLNPGTNLVELPASQLPAGAYVLRASLGNLSQQRFRVIKR